MTTLQCSNSLSPHFPWNGFSELAPFAPKRFKESNNHDVTTTSSASISSEVKDGHNKERKRPARIQIPKSCLNLDLGDAGMKEGLVEEGFEVQGSGYWLACRKGTRHAMEDSYSIITNIDGNPTQALFGVYDGHGGRAAVDFVSEKLGKNIMSALARDHQHDDDDESSLIELAVRDGYLATDREFLNQGLRGGACAATALLKHGELIVANLGDCRVVLSNNGTAEALTSDHKVGREDERIRIENSGGYVNRHNGVWRVQGSLAVSRAIGDASMKNWVISKPETIRLNLKPEHDFLIMASDGLWDKVSNQEAVDIISRHEKSIKSCKVLGDLSSSRGSRDDITVMVVDLQKFCTTSSH